MENTLLYFYCGASVKRTYMEIRIWLTERGIEGVDWKIPTVGVVDISFKSDSLRTMYALWSA